jgi:hypothetical protein
MTPDQQPTDGSATDGIGDIIDHLTWAETEHLLLRLSYGAWRARQACEGATGQDASRLADMAAELSQDAARVAAISAPISRHPTRREARIQAEAGQ